MNRTAFCFDLDGTISMTEMLPCIAAELEIAGEIATLTRLTMDGLIPFEDSMRLRTLILGRIAVERVHEILNEIPLFNDIVDFITAYTDQCFIVTGNLDVWIQPLVHKLGCRVFSSNAEIVDGVLRLKSILSKETAISNLRESRSFDKIVAIGDGANDVPMLQAADIGIAFGGVHTPVDAAIQAASLVVNDAKILCKLLKAL